MTPFERPGRDNTFNSSEGMMKYINGSLFVYNGLD